MSDPHEIYYDTPQELFEAHRTSKGPVAAYDDNVHLTLGFIDVEGVRHMCCLSTIKDREAYKDKGPLPDGVFTLLRTPLGRQLLFDKSEYVPWPQIKDRVLRTCPQSWLLELLGKRAIGVKLKAVEEPPYFGYYEVGDPYKTRFLIFQWSFESDPPPVPRYYAEMLKTKDGRKHLIEEKLP